MLFEENLGKIARKAEADQLADRVIVEQINRLAEYRGFKVRSEQIRIIRSSPFADTPELRIEIKYQKIVGFLGYVRVFQLESSVSSFWGPL